jgi:iron complex outermembrane receptor protein
MIGLGAVLKINAQEINHAIKQAAATPSATVPEIVVTAPKPKPKVARTPRAAGAGAVAANTEPTQAAPGTGTGPNGTIVPLAAVATVDKTGTPLANLPQSVVIVPRATIVEQGGTSVADAVRNVSGVNIGGSSTYGFFDRFTIRGMDARFYSDNFPDGDQSNGFPHSLNGVERIEVLKGPGSALFGSGPPGGSVNVVHFAPSAVPGYGLSQQVGSFGSWASSAYATGSTTIPGLNYRVDGLLQHSDGFRNLESANYEVRPVLQWNKDNHVTTFALDYRHIERTPDPYGILYFNGAALAGTPLNVPNTFKYSTPFGFGSQDFERGTLTDSWWFADYLTINNRLAYTHRDVSILRNSGGGTISFIGGTWQQTGRQLREQTDHDDDFTYQFEPVWKFHTGSVLHTLLTGTQIEWQNIDDNRATAALPNIANIFAPVIPETSTAGLNFMRTSALSGMIDDLRALYVSAYAADQIDVSEQWKVRLSARQDRWYEQLTPLAFVSSSTNPLAPGRFEQNGTPLEPGTVQTRIDQPTSWSIGTLYKILPTVAPFAGVSKSYLTNFNSEATSQGLVAPESGLEYEAGIKFSTPDNRIILTAAAFDIQRTNVFTENTATTPITVAFNAQKSYGFDADLQMLITPQWTVLANMISQTARLTAVPLTPAQVGNWPVGVPAHIYNIWSTYDFAIAGIRGFRVGAGVSYNGATYGSTANTVWIPSSTVADAMFGYYANNWDAQIGVKNITDVTYFITAQSAGGFVGQPRTFYAKAAWHY